MYPYAGCCNGVDWFRERDQWIDGNEEPVPGMIIFFGWDDPDGSAGPRMENPTIQASWNEWKMGLSILWKAIPETAAGRTIIPLGITRF